MFYSIYFWIFACINVVINDLLCCRPEHGHKGNKWIYTNKDMQLDKAHPGGGEASDCPTDLQWKGDGKSNSNFCFYFKH